MTTTPRFRPLVGASTAVSAVLLLASCGSADADTAAGNTTTEAAAADDHAHDDTPEKTEVDEPAPRLVAATETGAVVIDPATGEALATVDTEQRPRLSVADDGRHVLLNQPAANLTQILDTGSWSAAHGDHSHHYVAEPGLRESTIEGPNPIHVVSHSGHTAIFHDDAGSATVFDEAGLLIDNLETTSVSSEKPHHGVVVPQPGGEALVSIAGPDALPIGVARVDESGTEVARYEECPGLHGEAAVGDSAVFACEGSVMVLTGDNVTTLPYPDASGERIGALATLGSPDVEILLGDYADQSLAIVDLGQDAVRAIALTSTYGPYTLASETEVVVLTTDGTLRVLDPATGAETGAVPAVDAFELPEGHGGVTPSLTVVGRTVYIADPTASAIIPVDLDTLAAAEPIVLEDAPTDLVAVGTGGYSSHSGH